MTAHGPSSPEVQRVPFKGCPGWSVKVSGQRQWVKPKSWLLPPRWGYNHYPVISLSTNPDYHGLSCCIHLHSIVLFFIDLSELFGWSTPSGLQTQQFIHTQLVSLSQIYCFFPALQRLMLIFLYETYLNWKIKMTH